MEADDPKKKLKNSLDDWAEINNKNTEIGFTEGLFTAALAASPVIDKFSTWLLAGSGATAALMISNVEKLSPVLGSLTFKQSIYFLIVSALFGFLAKYKSIQSQIMLAIVDEVKMRALPFLDKHEEDQKDIVDLAEKHELEVRTEINFENVLREYCRAFPKIMHSWLLRQFTEGLNDRLATSRKAANGLFWQGNYTVLQFFSFLGFVLISVININGV